MTEILNYIDRLKKCGLGKQKALEFLEKYVEFYASEKELEKVETTERQNCMTCGHREQLRTLQPCKYCRVRFVSYWEEADD